MLKVFIIGIFLSGNMKKMRRSKNSAKKNYADPEGDNTSSEGGSYLSADATEFFSKPMKVKSFLLDLLQNEKLPL